MFSYKIRWKIIVRMSENNGNDRIMVWGAFSFSGSGELIRYDKHINAKDYIIFLRKDYYQLLTNYPLR